MPSCCRHMNTKNQMEKQINLAYFVGEERQPALSIPGILREAFKTTFRNGKLVLSIAFFMFIYYSLLGFADHQILAPLYSDLISKYALKPKDVSLGEIDPRVHKAILKDVRLIFLFKLIASALSSMILVTSVAAVVHSTHEAYTAKVLSFKEMLLSIRSRWKRPLITTFCMVLISLVSIVLFLTVLGMIGLMTDGSLLISLAIGLIIFGVCFYVYLSAVWLLSLVVSVLEENSSGMKAIDRAMELMKGKRLQGCVLMLILLLASLLIYATFALMAVNTQKSRLIWMVISISRIWSFSLKKLFAFVVLTVFYHECRRGNPVEDKTSVYVPISPIDF